MEHLSRFADEFLKALRNLLPIVTVVVLFQLLVLRSMPDDPLELAAGLLIVAVGIALFLYGLDLSIFPVGKNLANQFVRRGVLGLLLRGLQCQKRRYPDIAELRDRPALSSASALHLPPGPNRHTRQGFHRCPVPPVRVGA